MDGPNSNYFLPLSRRPRSAYRGGTLSPGFELSLEQAREIAARLQDGRRTEEALNQKPKACTRGGSYLWSCGSEDDSEEEFLYPGLGFKTSSMMMSLPASLETYIRLSFSLKFSYWLWPRKSHLREKLSVSQCSISNAKVRSQQPSHWTHRFAYRMRVIISSRAYWFSYDVLCEVMVDVICCCEKWSIDWLQKYGIRWQHCAAEAIGGSYDNTAIGLVAFARSQILVYLTCR